MGRSSGTGFPLTLRCHARTSWRGICLSTDLEATGRTRKAHWKRGHIHGIRQTNRAIEYRCRCCGHVGWTQHIEAERLLRTRGE